MRQQVTHEQGAAFRASIRTYLDSHLPDGWTGIGALGSDEAADFASRWRETLHQSGLLAPSWPKELGGGGLSEREQVILAEEFTRAGVPTRTASDAFGIQMLGNTLLLWGTEEQRKRLLPRILDGTDRWCQGYSEPAAGSDLAAVRTRAVLDGDSWVINGHKIWTSFAHLANKIFVLVRTSTDPGSRHGGLSFLLVPMDQEGVEVRPIKNINGETDFCEVFFTDARCHVSDIVANEGSGWKVAMTLLGFERGETAASMPVTFGAELDRLVRLASGLGRIDDALVMDRLTRAAADLDAIRALADQAVQRYVEGSPPGPEAAVFKLFWSEYHQRVTELSLDLLGGRALSLSGRPASGWTNFQTDDPGAPNDSRSWVETAMTARSGTIYAGTSEIQRNIIAERLLGLPR